MIKKYKEYGDFVDRCGIIEKLMDNTLLSVSFLGKIIEDYVGLGEAMGDIL